MTISLVTDSTCDLPEEVAARCGSTCVPLQTNFGLESYLDRVKLSRDPAAHGRMLRENFSTPGTWVSALVTVWGMRLGTYLVA